MYANQYNLRTTTPKSKVWGTQLNVEKFEYTIDVNQEHYLVGNQINGKFVYPVSGFIYLVWKSLAKLNGYQNIEQFPIMFENIQLLNRCPTTVESGKQYQFTVSIHPTTGLFELYESGVMVATGTVYPMEDKTVEMPLHQQTWSTVHQHETLSQDEIYKVLNLKGYEYLNEFQPIIKANIDGTYGELLWTGKWVPFLDGMIQMHLIGQKNGLFYPTQIKSIKIDPRVNFVKQRQDRGISLTHLMSTITLREVPTVLVPCRVNYLTNLTVCGGIEICGLVFEQIKQFSNIHQRQEMNVRYMPNIEQQQRIQLNLNNSVEKQVLDYYVNECRQLTTYITSKIECVGQARNVFVPRPLPKILQQEYVTIKSTVVPVTELVYNGKFLQLLIQAANLESTDAQYYNKVYRLFNDNSRFLRALEDDLVLNFLEKRQFFLQTFEQFLTRFNMIRFQNEERISHPVEFNQDYQRPTLIKTPINYQDENILKVKETLTAIKKLTDEVIYQQLVSAQGKVYGENGLLTILNGSIRKPTFHVKKATCEMYLSPTQTYIINCGNGQFSLEFTKWIVEHGARHIVLLSKVGTKNCTQIRQIIKLQEEYGVQIKCVSYDLADLSECFLLVKEATQMNVEKKIGGIFHLDVYQREVSFHHESQYQLRKLISENLLRISGMQGVMEKSAFIVVITNTAEQVPTEYVDMCSTLYKEGKQALTVDWETIGGEYTMLNEFNFGCDNKNKNLVLQQRVVDCLVNLEKFLVKNIDFNMFNKYSGYEKIQYQGEFDPSMPLVQVIAQICQIKDVDQWRNYDLTLGDLKIDNTMVSQIQSLLNQYIQLNTSEVLKLTYISINLIDQLKDNPTVLEASVRSLIKYQMPKRNFFNQKYF